MGFTRFVSAAWVIGILYLRLPARTEKGEATGGHLKGVY